MNGNLMTVIFVVIAVILMPLFGALFASYIGNNAHQELTDNWGPHSQQWLGGLGAIIHELGHLIMGLIFDQHVDHVKLLRLRHLNDYNTLGYVDLSWNKRNWYQVAGNFLVGIAPFYSCSAILYLLHKYLFHSAMSFPAQPVQSTHFCAYVVTNTLYNVGQSWIVCLQHPMNAIIFLILMVMISTTGYSLSHNDKHNMLLGLIPWSTFWILLSLVISFWNNNPADFNNYIWNFIIFSLYISINSLLYIVVSMYILRGIRYTISSGVLKRALYKPKNTFLRR